MYNYGSEMQDYERHIDVGKIKALANIEKAGRGMPSLTSQAKSKSSQTSRGASTGASTASRFGRIAEEAEDREPPIFDNVDVLAILEDLGYDITGVVFDVSITLIPALLASLT